MTAIAPVSFASIKAFASDCATCHPAQVSAWQLSDHAKAMAPAAPANILGAFDHRRADHFGLTGQFERDADGRAVMRLTRGSQSQRYPITHTFGHDPLQQYLTPTGDGHLQVLPFAWDSRPQGAGGQRWFHLYSDEDILPDDRLHWQQPLQNWNGMCADCHSTGLQRGYDPVADAFGTTRTAESVSCGSCHALAPDHGRQPGIAPNVDNAPAAPAAQPSMPSEAARWVRAESATIATRTTPPAAGAMDRCFGCHALRSPLTDGIDPAQPFLDQFTPQLPTAPLYFADGQIREEVYVWGSFLQSKMYAAGVTCGDCHDPHSQKLRAQGNAMCATCHAPGVFDTPKHHHHAPQSAGAECANCHMAERHYMVVDGRRDHSFRVPRPALAEQADAPDACTNCHQDQSPAWASTALKKWGAEPAPLSRERALFVRSQLGQALTDRELGAVLAAPALPSILRAATLQNQLTNAPDRPVPGLSSLLRSAEPLTLLAALRASAALPPVTRASAVGPLLSHERRAVRVAAAAALEGSRLAERWRQPFAAALAEANTAMAQSAWRGEGRLNQALAAQQRRDIDGARTALSDAIRVDPYFEPAHINLAELERDAGNTAAERAVLEAAIALAPRGATLRYSYALHLVRAADRERAEAQARTATELAPADARFATLYALLLDARAGPAAAMAWLGPRWQTIDSDPGLVQLTTQLAARAGVPPPF
ncbi:MAG: multiheme c-type cytochrome [Pseudomonadota bacterium]